MPDDDAYWSSPNFKDARVVGRPTTSLGCPPMLELLTHVCCIPALLHLPTYYQGVAVVESMDSIPQYGRCNLSRAVITRPRLVSRDLNDGNLANEVVERRTLVGGTS